MQSAPEAKLETERHMKAFISTLADAGLMLEEVPAKSVLRGRTPKNYLSLVGGRISRLALKIQVDPPGKWPQRYSYAPDPVLDKIFEKAISEEEERKHDFHGEVLVRLLVDTLPKDMFPYQISLAELLISTTLNGEHEILTCSCGYAPCAGINKGIEVAHGDGLLVWRIRGVAPRRVVVFEREQYRQEVFEATRRALEARDALGPEAVLGASNRPEFLQLLLAGAERRVVA